MKYAVVNIKGHQYKVSEGDEIDVSRLSEKEGEDVSFDRILLLADGGKAKIGRPFIPKASVTAQVLKHFLDKKVRVATYKAKSRYRRVKGHRSKLTKIKIKKIS